MTQIFKMLSVAVVLGLSILPFRAPSVARHAAHAGAPVTAAAGTIVRPAGPVALDGRSIQHWSAEEAVWQAEYDRAQAQAKAEADAAAAAQAAADAAAQAAADQAAAAARAAQIRATTPAAPAPAVVAAAPKPASGSIQDIIRAAFQSQGQGAIDWALRVAACESGYNPNAYNASSGASGLFQFMPGTWRGTPEANQNIFDAYANAAAAAYTYAHQGGTPWSCK
ncbi:MAG: hypothetical protein NVS9B1_01310 [Candidatus Dormibacteraceae bacterium]